MEIKYDRKADAIYVRLDNKPYAYGKDLDNERRIDYASDGKPIGIEITCVSQGVNVYDLPYQNQVGKLLANYNIKVLV